MIIAILALVIFQLALSFYLVHRTRCALEAGVAREIQTMLRLTDIKNIVVNLSYDHIALQHAEQERVEAEDDADEDSVPADGVFLTHMGVDKFDLPGGKSGGSSWRK
jgi:hypothetical protein